MKKLYVMLLITVLLITGGFIFDTNRVDATSWIKLEPAEVDNRAEVIVLGRYDFSNSIRKTQRYQDVFSPIIFKVDKYYRGSGPEEITTGIDNYDIGWAKKLQKEGGSFLLFLERDKDNKDFLIPIVGPNGMKQVINDKVKTGNINEETYFNNILLNQTSSAPIPKERNNTMFYTLGVILLVILCVIIVMRKINYPKQP